MKSPELFESLNVQPTKGDANSRDLYAWMRYEVFGDSFKLIAPKNMKEINWQHLVIAMFTSRNVQNLVLPDKTDQNDFLELINKAIANLANYQNGIGDNIVKRSIKAFNDNHIGQFPP